MAYCSTVPSRETRLRLHQHSRTRCCAPTRRSSVRRARRLTVWGSRCGLPPNLAVSVLAPRYRISTSTQRLTNQVLQHMSPMSPAYYSLHTDLFFSLHAHWFSIVLLVFFVSLHATLCICLSLSTVCLHLIPRSGIGNFTQMLLILLQPTLRPKHLGTSLILPLAAVEWRFRPATEPGVSNHATGKHARPWHCQRCAQWQPVTTPAACSDPLGSQLAVCFKHVRTSLFIEESHSVGKLI